MNEIKPTRSIGVRKPLVDGPEKVSGKALYSGDFIPADCLVGQIYRSPISHGEIIDVDISKAEALPGVKAIITGDETDETFGVLPIARFEYPLARDKVRYKGEPVACVAAIDAATAQQAIELIKVKYKELPAYFTSKEAMADGSINIHEHREGNIERDVDFDLGETDNGLESAHLIMEETFNCAEIAQVQSEPHAAIAEYDENRDFMTVRASTQVPYYGHKMLAKILKMELLGGSWGDLAAKARKRNKTCWASWGHLAAKAQKC